MLKIFSEIEKESWGVRYHAEREIELMKKLLCAFLIIFGIASCSNEPEFREEIIERHAGGEKKIVAHYRGHGTNEQLVERFTYGESGDLLLKEDLQNNIKLNWVQLHPELKTVRGLKDYLQGGWVSEQIKNQGEVTESYEKIVLNINGSKFTVIMEGKYKDGGDGWSTNNTSTIEYKSNYFIVLSQPENDDIKSGETQLNIESKNTFIMSPEIPGYPKEFHRID